MTKWEQVLEQAQARRRVIEDRKREEELNRLNENQELMSEIEFKLDGRRHRKIRRKRK